MAKTLQQFLFEGRRAKRLKTAWNISSAAYRYGGNNVKYGKKRSSYKNKRKKRRRKK